MAQSYQYNDVDFASAASGPAVDALEAEIRSSAVTIAISSVLKTSGVTTVSFKADVQAADEAILTGLVASHAGISLSSDLETDNGIQLFSIAPEVLGSTPTIITSNWCDPTTWYSGSIRVTDEALVDSGDKFTYNSLNANWLDLRAGALTQGHDVWANYEFKVRKNGEEQVPNDRNGNGGVYSVNASVGSITFDDACDVADVIEADYSWASDSTWILKPNAGKQLLLRTVEVQFSMDIDLTTASVFAPYGPVDVFSPQLLDSNGGPYPSGTMIPLKTNRYETMHNYIEEAQHSYATIPKMGGVSWRGMQSDVHLFRWPYTGDYGGPVVLKSSLGMELRIYLERNIPFGGERAVASVYATSQDE
jgi:hypothetical protein